MTNPAISKHRRRSRRSTFRWDERKHTAVDLMLLGASNRLIARRVGANRSTVNEWVRNPEFQAEARRRLQEHLDAYRIRRLRETIRLADRVHAQLDRALTEADAAPTNNEALRRLSGWLTEYRKLRKQERLDFGDDAERGALRGALRPEAVHPDSELHRYLDLAD